MHAHALMQETQVAEALSESFGDLRDAERKAMETIRFIREHASGVTKTTLATLSVMMLFPNTRV